MVRLVRFNREPAFNNLFSHFFEGELGSPTHRPAANIKENDTAFNLSVFVAGYKKEEINIEIEENILTVSAEVSVDKEEVNWQREYSLESFSRSFQLPKTIDIEAIKAEHIDGVLSIEIPKIKEEQKVKKLIAIA